MLLCLVASKITFAFVPTVNVVQAASPVLGVMVAELFIMNEADAPTLNDVIDVALLVAAMLSCAKLPSVSDDVDSAIRPARKLPLTVTVEQARVDPKGVDQAAAA